MSKEAWFRNYERLYDEREDSGDLETDEELAERAYKIQEEQQLERADYERDRAEDAWLHTLLEASIKAEKSKASSQDQK